MSHLFLRILVIMSVLVPKIVLAQGDIIGKTERLLGKRKYEKARQYIAKSIKKDSTSAYQALAVYFLHPQQFDTDSALIHNSNAISLLDKLPNQQLQRLAKYGVNKKYLTLFKNKIDSIAYLEVQKLDNLNKYHHYIKTHSTSLYLDSAVARRDVLAFANAQKINTYQSYKEFLDQYPDALQIPQARKRYELLFFQKRVVMNNLQSYMDFLDEHPSTKYRTLAEWEILQLSTLSNSVQDYYSFVRQYPNSTHAKVAFDYAYHIDKEMNKIPKTNKKYYDSLQSAHTYSLHTLFPIYNNGYGFIDSMGKTIVPIIYNSDRQISKIMYSGKDFYWLKDSISSSLVSMEGKRFYHGHIDEVMELGKGLIMYETQGKKGLIHLSGFKVLPPECDDIKTIDNQFVAYLKGKDWGVCSALGKIILSPQYDNVSTAGEFIILTKGEKYSITNSKQIVQSIKGNFSPKFNYNYNDYEYLGKNKIIGFKDRYLELLNQNLENLLPSKVIDVKKVKEHFICRTLDSYFVVNYTTLDADCSSDQPIIGNKAGIFIKKNNLWYSYSHTQSPIEADSIDLLGDYFVKIYSKGKLSFSENSTNYFPTDISYQLTKYGDEAYVVATNKNGIKIIIDSNGRTTKLSKWDKVEAIGDSLWLVQHGRKKGIINYSRNNIKKIICDGIKRLNDNTFTILKGGKFGAYLFSQRKVIGTKYDKQLLRYNDSLYIATRGGMEGLIDLQGKTIIPHEYDKIHYWNDTSALVKKGYQWMIQNLEDNRTIIQNIAQYEDISSKNSKAITLKIFQNNSYGVIDSASGIVVPISFYNVYPIDRNGTIIFVAEKYIEEADFYVVIYYNTFGKIIYKQAMKSQNYQQVK